MGLADTLKALLEVAESDCPPEIAFERMNKVFDRYLTAKRVELFRAFMEAAPDSELAHDMLDRAAIKIPWDT